jgi:hypothetical protein
VSLNIIFFVLVIRAVLQATADPIDISQKKLKRDHPGLPDPIATGQSKKICSLEAAAVCTRKLRSFLKSLDPICFALLPAKADRVESKKKTARHARP